MFMERSHAVCRCWFAYYFSYRIVTMSITNHRHVCPPRSSCPLSHALGPDFVLRRDSHRPATASDLMLFEHPRTPGRGSGALALSGVTVCARLGLRKLAGER